MDFSIATAAVVFVLIALVELPDKTFVATLVLSTRFRPLLVWTGVTLAFVVQTLIAVTLGGLIGRLPRTPVEIVAGALFLIGGVILLRSASGADAEEREAEEEFSDKGSTGLKGWHVVAMSFGVLFVAEWGDLTQILTASLVLRYHQPVSVFVGALLALSTVSALGAVLGRALLTRMRLSTIRRVGGVVCLILASVTALQVSGVL